MAPMQNIPEVKLALVGVSRNCFPAEQRLAPRLAPQLQLQAHPRQ